MTLLRTTLPLTMFTGIVSFFRSSAEPDEDMSDARAGMVDQLRAYGIRDEEILRAMARVRRHAFIPADCSRFGNPYGDHPLPIGRGQTISQPFIVAYMTERLHIRRGNRILEVGCGSGYQAAILAELGADVFSIELVPALAEHARAALSAEGYGAVHITVGDGYNGWPENAPYDAIIVTCAPTTIPPALVEQLKENATMILPVGSGFQRLMIVRRTTDGVETDEDLSVAFVPMVRRQDWNPVQTGRFSGQKRNPPIL